MELKYLTERGNDSNRLTYTVRVLNFMGKIFVFLVDKKIRGVLIFVAMAAW